MPIKRLLTFASVFFAGAAVAYVLSSARPRERENPIANPGTITILAPDPDSPTGRRTIRLRSVPLEAIPRREDTSVAMPDNGWVLDVAGVTYYGVP